MLALAQSVQSRLLSLVGEIKYQLLEHHFIHTFRVGLVLSTVLLTLMTAILVAKLGLIGLVIVAGLAGVLILVFVYRYTTLGVSLLIITTTIADSRLPNDLTITLGLLILLAVVWLGKLLLVERSFRSVRPPFLRVIVALWILAVVVSFLWSSHYVEPQVRALQDSKLLPRVATVLVMTLSPVAMLLFANFLRSIEDIKRVVWYFIGFGVFMLISTLLHLPLPPTVNNHGLLVTWVCILAFGQVLFNRKLPWQVRLLLLVCVGTWSYIMISTKISWVSGWLPLGLGCGFLLLLRSRIAFVLLAVVAAGYVLGHMDLVDKIFAAEDQESGVTRGQAGGAALSITKDHFLFGTGPAGYYYYISVEADYFFQLSHNTYVDILAETGIVGFSLFLAIWGGIGWTVVKTYRMVPKQAFSGGLAASLVAAYPTTLLLMMLGDWGIPFAYTQSLAGLRYTIWAWLWAGMAIALGYCVRQPMSDQTTSLPSGSISPG